MKMWLRCHVIRWVGSSHSSYHPAKVVGLGPCEKVKYFWFVTWPLDPSVRWLCRWGPFTLRHHSGKFGFHRAWESGDLTSLICHVTTWLMCHVTCGWGSLILNHHSARLGVHRPCESGNITSLICHVTTCFMCHVTCGWGSLIVSHYPAKFGVHRPCENGDITFFICLVTMASKCHVTLCVGSSHPKSPPC